MTDTFITAIHVKKVCQIEDFAIPLSETERKHLVITGKNGSGKTSLLREINKFLAMTIIQVPNYHSKCEDQIISLSKILQSPSDINHKTEVESRLTALQTGLLRFGNTKINFNNEHGLHKQSLVVFFEAKRIVTPAIPQGINKVNLKERYQTTDQASKDFIQYIVNLKAERSFAKDDNDTETVQRIDAWFDNVEAQLKNLFDAPDLHLVFDRQNYNFLIQIGDNTPFAFTELSDGYSAVISIVTELIMRMEATGHKRFDQQGIVLVDEIETHLHVALQKQIMPFLCAFFPNIQFIVTTHSPFVLSSINNAVVCDLETREVLTDLSGYSYEALVEGYFHTDKYSELIKNKLQRYEQLATADTLAEAESDEYRTLKRYFDGLPTFLADGLAVKLQQIKLQQLTHQG
ncbi:AAA family ATPase [Methylovulum psychrotolerans]|uniref:AAA family ATPase n=1 Tax=Methylovulum psychrotolerans TaxID=1704499 RepID=A0A2S5CM28_9GAMM|nr:AAA family ATPase [Methylovulum psychrotolerans]POZ51875.1 AAA family ATPase [Methylovulum psychrotolerans]